MTWQDFYLVLATGSWIWLVFAFAFGACVGSLTNVLVYRLPLGLSVVSPPSRCPMCHTKLTWRENIPVFGWIFLRGRCRFCKSPISPEYPLVEAFVGVLFAPFFVLWYTLPSHAHWLGVDWAMIRPDWAKWDATFDHWPHESWPMFIVLLVLVASLVAMSLVDLKTYTIPLQIPWFATIVALLFHVGYAAYITLRHQQDNFMPGNEFAWSLPTPANRFGQGNWWWIGASLGAMSGLLFANLALHFGWIRRSFSDYAEWEAQHLKKPTDDQHPAAPSAPEHPAAPVDYEWPSWIPRFASFSLVCTLTLVSFTVAGYFFSKHRGGPAWAGLLIGALVAPLVAALAVRPLIARAGKANSKSGGEAATAGPADSTPADDWILYPYARREMLKELVFLAPCIALAWLGGTLATNTGGTALIPLWLNVLTGVLMGYLIGGGVVWGARLFGSLAFGKEAMGLGDVHLMAAVGACTGWIDATLAFPLAAVVGLYWVIVHALAHRQMPRAMQFGPYLAVATVLVILGKPLVELGLTFLLKSDMPINLP